MHHTLAGLPISCLSGWGLNQETWAMTNDDTSGELPTVKLTLAKKWISIGRLFAVGCCWLGNTDGGGPNKSMFHEPSAMHGFLVETCDMGMILMYKMYTYEIFDTWWCLQNNMIEVVHMYFLTP